jgi:hypothetical protein
MNMPINPPPVFGSGRHELPAYVSNGLIGPPYFSVGVTPSGLQAVQRHANTSAERLAAMASALAAAASRWRASASRRWTCSANAV